MIDGEQSKATEICRPIARLCNIGNRTTVFDSQRSVATLHGNTASVCRPSFASLWNSSSGIYSFLQKFTAPRPHLPPPTTLLPDT